MLWIEKIIYQQTISNKQQNDCFRYMNDPDYIHTYVDSLLLLMEKISILYKPFIAAVGCDTKPPYLEFFSICFAYLIFIAKNIWCQLRLHICMFSFVTSYDKCKRFGLFCLFFLDYINSQCNSFSTFTGFFWDIWDDIHNFRIWRWCHTFYKRTSSLIFHVLFSR